ncbi:MAG: hypothetical protein GF347_03940 [Candidatus Moranbacteria bacterium]|nr:hypothetical protein [Candidatus Moranbacteria bacterium]
MKNKYTLWGLTALGSISSFSGWMAFSAFYQKEELSWSNLLISFIIYLFIALILAVVDWKYSLILSSIALFPAIVITFNFSIVLIYLLSIFLFYKGLKRIEKNTENSIKIKIGRSLLVGYSLITLPLCLNLSASYFYELKEKKELNQLPDFEIQIPEKLTTSLLKIFKSFLKEDFYIEDTDQTIEEYIRVYVEKEAQKKNFDQNLLDLNQSNIALARQNFAEQFEIEVEKNEKISSVANKIINKKINDNFNSLKEENKDIPIWGLTIGLFFTIKTITWIARIPLSFLVSLLIRGAIKLNLLTIVKKTVKVERLK